jgi:hypothetical protein
MKYEISSQCKTNENQVSEESNANVGVFFVGSVKRKPKLPFCFFLYMVPELYFQALRLLMMKTAEKRLIQ